MGMAAEMRRWLKGQGFQVTDVVVSPDQQRILITLVNEAEAVHFEHRAERMGGLRRVGRMVTLQVEE